LGGKHAGEAEFDRVIANVGYHADASISVALDVAKRAGGGCPAVH
jgi:hypothetical protein